MLGTMRRTYAMKDDLSSEEQTEVEKFQGEILIELCFLKVP